MIESLFYFLVLVAVAITAIGFDGRKMAYIAFGGLLLLMCGTLIMGAANSTVGIEKEYGSFARSVGDNNYNLDLNVGYLNSGNDQSLFILSNVFFYGGLVLILGSFVVGVASYRNSKRRGL